MTISGGWQFCVSHLTSHTPLQLWCKMRNAFHADKKQIAGEAQKGENACMKMIMPATLQVNPPDEPMPALQKIRVVCYIRVGTDDPAQEESRTISENLRWSFDRRASKGDLPNYACYGFRLSDEKEVTETGYKRRKVEIIPEELPDVNSMGKAIIVNGLDCQGTLLVNPDGTPNEQRIVGVRRKALQKSKEQKALPKNRQGREGIKSSPPSCF